MDNNNTFPVCLWGLFSRTLCAKHWDTYVIITVSFNTITTPQKLFLSYLFIGKKTDLEFSKLLKVTYLLRGTVGVRILSTLLQAYTCTAAVLGCGYVLSKSSER